uniref:Transmembrane protein n=1 Tax=Vitrella brassicaformis TaxID=1169539 RepID=A0A7S1KKQ4_9ALVE|mmetsp:Transcript_9506/g.23239  ORF Transcript_9506/g.23239 Transcript_9506/m.23239 type:complete len:227 (+) Transcript_9506:49-729(+)
MQTSDEVKARRNKLTSAAANAEADAAPIDEDEQEAIIASFSQQLARDALFWRSLVGGLASLAALACATVAGALFARLIYPNTGPTSPTLSDSAAGRLLALVCSTVSMIGAAACAALIGFTLSSPQSAEPQPPPPSPSLWSSLCSCYVLRQHTNTLLQLEKLCVLVSLMGESVFFVELMNGRSVSVCVTGVLVGMVVGMRRWVERSIGESAEKLGQLRGARYKYRSL